MKTRKFKFPTADNRPEAKQLLAKIKKAAPVLKKLLAEVSGHWEMEDRVYRFYHGSFKVYSLQAETERIVKALAALSPTGMHLNEQFMRIIRDGTDKQFHISYNKDWDKHTRPIVEAFFHAHYFLTMICKYSTLPKPPAMLPSGWAAVLYLYNLR